MFRWFKKPKAEPAAPPADQAAYDVGRQMGQGFVEALESFMSMRFSRIHDNYLDVLRSRLQTALQATDGPPLTIGRIDYKIFLEELQKLEVGMLEETRVALSGWVELAKQADLAEPTVKFIEERVKAVRTDLTLAGWEDYMNYVDALRDADNRWRIQNPDKAREFPLDTPQAK